MARDETYHDDNTLNKAFEAGRRAGLSLVDIENAINEMLNAGILFREHGPVQGTSGDIENRFKYHKPQTAKRADQHEFIRQACRGLADDFAEALPNGREKSLAITKVEEAMFWANAALARTPEPDAVPPVVESYEREAGVQRGTVVPGDMLRRLEQAGVQRAPEGYPRTFPGPNPPPVTDQDRTEIRELIEAGTPPLKATSDVLARKLEQAGVQRAPEGTDPNTWQDEDESPPDPDDSALGPDPRDAPTGGVPGRDHPGLDGAWHIGHMEECGRCDAFAKIHDPNQGNYGPGQPRDPRDVPPGY